MSLAKRLQEALEEAGAKPAHLAKAAKVSRPTVSGWLDGSIKEIKGSNLIAAARFLRVNSIWLSSGKGPRGVDDSTELTVAESDLLDIYRSLSKADQAVMRRVAEALGATAAAEEPRD